MAKLLQDAAKTRKRLRQIAEETDKISLNQGIIKKSQIEINNNDDTTALLTNNTTDLIQAKDISNILSKQHKRILIDKTVQNIIYLGHIPNGFYEYEMRKFFTQFGKVTRVKLFRSIKTNNSKGYAYIQFETEDVAKVVSEAMNGYMMDNKQLVCHVVEKDKIHYGMFKKHYPVKSNKKD